MSLSKVPGWLIVVGLIVIGYFAYSFLFTGFDPLYTGLSVLFLAGIVWGLYRVVRRLSQHVERQKAAHLEHALLDYMEKREYRIKLSEAADFLGITEGEVSDIVENLKARNLIRVKKE